MLTFLSWLFAVRILPKAMYASLVFGGRGDSTFLDVFRRNPYCVVDPTCISPWVSSSGGTSAGQGLALNEFWSMNNVSGLAWPNYVFFMLLLMAVAFVVAKCVPSRRHLRFAALDVVGAWCVVEVNRWFANINHSISAHAESVLLWQQIGVTVFSLLLIALAACLAWGQPFSSEREGRR
jgi:hypothetical protein